MDRGATAQPGCTVVIPCHGGAALTAACVHSLLAQQAAPPLEILLVDNQSPDHTAELSAIDGRVRVLRQASNLGFAGGVNAGVRAARHPLLLILNNDTLAAPNMLMRMLAALASDPRIGLVAPVSNFVKGPALLSIGNVGRDADVRNTIEAELAATCGGRVQDQETLSGLCLLLRRSTFDAVGAFDERFGHGNYEDDDFCLRARLLGHRLVIARDAFLHHEGHATFDALGLDYRQEIDRRRAQFVAKWQDDPAGAAVLAAERADFAAAVATLAAARGRYPAWPDADWIAARHCAAGGDHAGTAAHLRPFLAACPSHTGAAILLALSQLRLHDARGAAVTLRHLQAHCHVDDRSAAELLLKLGEQARLDGDAPRAIAHFRDALAYAPDDAALHNWLGVAQLDAGDLAAARASLQRAAEMGFALAHTNLGICSYRAGDRAAALAHCERAVELLPQDPVAQNNLRALLTATS